MKKLNLSFLFIMVFFLTSCGFIGGGDCPESMVGGPSCGDGDGPGSGVLAKVEDTLFVGSCANDTAACSEEISPVSDDGETVVYHVQKSVTYTWEVCVIHPGVSGRLIDVYIGFLDSGGRGSGDVRTVFDESTRPSPVCFSASFSFGEEIGGFYTVYQIVEGQGDLQEGNMMSKSIYFQVVS